MIASVATAFLLLLTGAGCAALSPSTETAPTLSHPPTAPSTASARSVVPSDAPESGAGSSTASSPTVDPESGLRWISLPDLPVEAVQTLRLVESGGPYPHDRDGVTFENREEILPDRPQGYYREFTVETPGSADRGARRIVVGAAGEEYYTDDHYDSFVRIKQ